MNTIVIKQKLRVLRISSSKRQVFANEANASFSYRFDALADSEPTCCLPEHDILSVLWKYADGLTLADPNFSKSSRVD